VCEPPNDYSCLRNPRGELDWQSAVTSALKRKRIRALRRPREAVLQLNALSDLQGERRASAIATVSRLSGTERTPRDKMKPSPLFGVKSSISDQRAARPEDGASPCGQAGGPVSRLRDGMNRGRLQPVLSGCVRALSVEVRMVAGGLATPSDESVRRSHELPKVDGLAGVGRREDERVRAPTGFEP
jgi:hypothetical protein